MDIAFSTAHTSERGIKDYVFLNSSAEKDTLTANDWAITTYKRNLFDEKRRTLPRCHVRDSQRFRGNFFPAENNEKIRAHKKRKPNVAEIKPSRKSANRSS